MWLQNHITSICVPQLEGGGGGGKDCLKDFSYASNCVSFSAKDTMLIYSKETEMQIIKC
jgi:hypothetical protein